jgi:hypothetical protein
MQVVQGICDIFCTILWGAEQIRVCIPEIGDGAVASLSHVAAPVIERTFSLCNVNLYLSSNPRMVYAPPFAEFRALPHQVRRQGKRASRWLQPHVQHYR